MVNAIETEIDTSELERDESIELVIRKEELEAERDKLQKEQALVMDNIRALEANVNAYNGAIQLLEELIGRLSHKIAPP